MATQNISFQLELMRHDPVMRESFEKLQQYLCGGDKNSLQSQLTILRETINNEDITALSEGVFERYGDRIEAGTYFLRDGTPSNSSGVPISLVNPKIILISVSASEPVTGVLMVQEHSGGSFTDKREVTLTNQKTLVFAPPETKLTKGKELAVRVNSGLFKRTQVNVLMSGDSV